MSDSKGTPPHVPGFDADAKVMLARLINLAEALPPPLPVVPQFDADAKVMLGRLIGLVETFPLRFDRIESNAVAERAATERRLSTIEDGLGKVKARQYWLTGAHGAGGVALGFIAAHWQSLWKP